MDMYVNVGVYAHRDMHAHTDTHTHAHAHTHGNYITLHMKKWRPRESNPQKESGADTTRFNII